MAAGVARPNPSARIDYPREAYAGAAGGAAGPPRRSVTDVRTAEEDGDEDEVRGGTSPWLWLSAILAVGVLALAAFLLMRFLGGPGESPAPEVTVPSFVGMTFDEARDAATEAGLLVEQVDFVLASAEFGTVTSQTPAAGALVPAGSTVDLIMAVGPETTIVPDLRLKPENEAINLIFAAGLIVGTTTEEFDEIVPQGSIVRHEPGAGQSVARGTAVDYVVSLGPEPTPEPTPTPTPPPPPTPPPTPTPPPPPTPTPVPDLTVGDYRCQPLLEAQAEIENDGFELGSVSGPNADDAWVVWQQPQPGAERRPGFEIDLFTVDQPAPTVCPAEPA